MMWRTFVKFISLNALVRIREFDLSLKMDISLLNRIIKSSIYNNNETNSNPMIDWKNLWRLPPPHCVLMFGWKCHKNDSPIRAIIKSKLNSIDELGPICGKEENSRQWML